MRLRPTCEKLALSDGKAGYALDAVQGLQYQLNIGKLALIITAPAEAFEAIVLDHGRGGTAPPIKHHRACTLITTSPAQGQTAAQAP